ncbi:MAG: glycosyltransferase [Flavobacteriales bacterium]|nr:glycosyltransferase [Flavobacteriales bacterium]
MSVAARGAGTIVFLSYWGSDEPLTFSTVLPTLRMLVAEGMARRVVLCTVERPGRRPPMLTVPPGCTHVQWSSTTGLPKPLARAVDVLRMRRRLAHVLRHESPDLVMARGVIAGGLAHRVATRLRIPYAVDYFEPHADYMADVGVWSRGGLMYRGLKRLITAQTRTALRMVCVSHNYRRMLMAEGVDGDRILVAPCPVDAALMRFDGSARVRNRACLGIGAGPVAIYLGKFGGLYHREHAFRAFARFLERAGHDAHMIIRTPEPVEHVLDGMRRAGADPHRVHVGFARHDEVPGWLSASDIAFAPYRGTPSSACISPMKIGEYWANGLPVVLTRGVGDDSAIIDAEPLGGAVFDPEGDDLDDALDRVLAVVCTPGQRSATAALAERHRSMALTREAYARILEAWAAIRP